MNTIRNKFVQVEKNGYWKKIGNKENVECQEAKSLIQ